MPPASNDVTGQWGTGRWLLHANRPWSVLPAWVWRGRRWREDRDEEAGPGGRFRVAWTCSDRGGSCARPPLPGGPPVLVLLLRSIGLHPSFPRDTRNTNHPCSGSGLCHGDARRDRTCLSLAAVSGLLRISDCEEDGGRWRGGETWASGRICRCPNVIAHLCGSNCALP